MAEMEYFPPPLPNSFRNSSIRGWKSKKMVGKGCAEGMSVEK